jgi:hypothetical protein
VRRGASPTNDRIRAKSDLPPNAPKRPESADNGMAASGRLEAKADVRRAPQTTYFDLKGRHSTLRKAGRLVGTNEVVE